MSTIHTIRDAIRAALQDRRAVIVGIGIAIAFLWLSLLLPQVSTIRALMRAHVYSVWDILLVVLTTWGSLLTNFTWYGRVFVFALALLTGINSMLFVHFIRCYVRATGAASAGVLGMMTGMLGIGCASCGSVLLTSLLGLTASSHVIAMLPLHGIEFSVLGIAGLFVSIWLLARKIESPNGCRISR